jgi:protein O-mannosyl-transferase
MKPSLRSGPPHGSSFLQPMGIKSNLLLLFGLTFSVLLVYLPLTHNGFVNWDDVPGIVNNQNLRSIDSELFRWIFTGSPVNWMPLTWFSLALNISLGGLDPQIIHWTNLFLHIFNTLLVFAICFRISRLAMGNGTDPTEHARKFSAIAPAFLTALLFGIHPIHVESVAWASERKDLIYSFFYLLGIGFYLDYGSEENKRLSKLFFCFCLFVLSVMSKPMALTLPVVFLILDYWPLKRLREEPIRVLVEKIPFIIVSILLGVATMRLQTGFISSLGGPADVSLRLNPFRSLFFYLWKMAAPVGLVPFYPLPNKVTNWYQWVNISAVFSATGITWILFTKRRKYPFLLAGWLYYVVTLIPVLGFIQVGSQAAADRYVYLASLGPFFLFSGVTVFYLCKQRALFYVLCASICISLGILTVRQVGVWQDSTTLWMSVLRAYPEESPIPYTNLGIYYLKAGKVEDAIQELERALTIPPPYPQTNNALGVIFLNEGRLDQAIQQFEDALSIDPGYENARKNLDEAYAKKRRPTRITP